MEENNATPPSAAEQGEQTRQSQQPNPEIVVEMRPGPAGHVSSPQEPESTSPSRNMLGATGPRRVLQPSASFMQELQTGAASQPDPLDQAIPEPAGQPGGDSELTTALTLQDVAESPVATIPTPVLETPTEPKQFRVPPPAIGQAQWHHRVPKPGVEQQPTGVKNIVILVGIYIIGGIITLGSGYSLYRWTHIRSLSGIGVEQVVSILLSLVLFLAGIGILRRKELGRIVYVYLAIISLVLSLYGTVKFYHAIVTVQKYIPTQIAYQQASENSLRNNSYLSSDDKQALISSYDKQIADLKKKQGSPLLLTVGGLPMYLIVDYVVATLPVIFLTRAAVRAEFEN